MVSRIRTLHRGGAELAEKEKTMLGVAKWWERVKTRPSHETAITKWLRPEDIARYEKITDTWSAVSKNLAH